MRQDLLPTRRQEPTLPKVELAPEAHPADDGVYDTIEYGDDLGYDPRRSTMGRRPLPPDDPSENPEQRANRIRSFYKEYFDDSKPSKPSQPSQPSQQQYYDGSENFGHDGHYNANQQYNQNAYPPRGPSRFNGAERHRATISNGSFAAGPRAFSSASGRYGPPGRVPPPKKNLPPPKPLHVLPTPHMLKDDIILPMDFAPPASYRGQRSGTPDSLKGGVRPYSPALRAHTPLVSSFDDLSVMPSPHELRKSATFTNLDFAPPRRFRDERSNSDAGSVHSGRSNTSAMQVHNIRAGAYRVSRIPKEVSGTKLEMSDMLKPRMDMR